MGCIGCYRARFAKADLPLDHCANATANIGHRTGPMLEQALVIFHGSAAVGVPVHGIAEHALLGEYLFQTLACTVRKPETICLEHRIRFACKAGVDLHADRAPGFWIKAVDLILFNATISHSMHAAVRINPDTPLNAANGFTPCRLLCDHRHRRPDHNQCGNPAPD